MSDRICGEARFGTQLTKRSRARMSVNNAVGRARSFSKRLRKHRERQQHALSLPTTRPVQSAEREALNFVVVGSIPAVGAC